MNSIRLLMLLMLLGLFSCTTQEQALATGEDTVDTDGDGVIDSLDCAPENPEKFRAASYEYRDADNDGYKVALAGTICSDKDLPEGYSLTPGSFDCDDTDPTKGQSYYRDTDGDGYGAGESSCTNDGIGWAINNSDCDDTNASLHQLLSYTFRDADNDGYTDFATGKVCSGASLPSGYANTGNGSDCDDQDASKYQYLNGYLDSDSDGHGDYDAIQTSVCSGDSLASGYSLTNDDFFQDDALHRNVTATIFGDDKILNFRALGKDNLGSVFTAGIFHFYPQPELVVDENGQDVWFYDDNAALRDLDPHPDREVYITPSVFDRINASPNGYRDNHASFINKTNAEGVSEWTVVIHGISKVMGITSDDQNNIYIAGGYRHEILFNAGDNELKCAGHPYSSTSDHLYSFIAKYSASGEFMWADCLNEGILFISGFVYTDITFSNGRLYVAGGAYLNCIDVDNSAGENLYRIDNGLIDIIVHEVSLNGEHIDMHILERDKNYTAEKIFISDNGDITILASEHHKHYPYTIHVDYKNYIIIRYNSSFQEQWSKIFTMGEQRLHDLVVDSSGNPVGMILNVDLETTAGRLEITRFDRNTGAETNLKTFYPNKTTIGLLATYGDEIYYFVCIFDYTDKLEFGAINKSWVHQQDRDTRMTAYGLPMHSFMTTSDGTLVLTGKPVNFLGSSNSAISADFTETKPIANNSAEMIRF